MRITHSSHYYVSPEWEVVGVLKGFKSLYIDGKNIYGYFKGWLCRAKFDLSDIEYLAPFPWAIRAISKTSRLLERVFRIAPTTAVKAGNLIYIVRKNEIWIYDIDAVNLKLDFVIPGGRKCLNIMTHIYNNEFRVVFGEYFSNPKRNSVQIWEKRGDGGWGVVHAFPVGSIDHIHSIVKHQQDLYILTGDFDTAAGIWHADMSFKVVTPVLIGSQMYRATWLDSIGGSILYATDSQLERNFLVEWCGRSSGDEPSKLSPIDGSSIYFGRSEDQLFFSTTVEAGKPGPFFLVNTFDMKLGDGILSPFACVYAVGMDRRPKLVFMSQKDSFPSRLAQFGTFTFPGGHFLQVALSYQVRQFVAATIYHLVCAESLTLCEVHPS